MPQWDSGLHSFFILFVFFCHLPLEMYLRISQESTIAPLVLSRQGLLPWL